LCQRRNASQRALLLTIVRVQTLCTFALLRKLYCFR
jgi:hypothetical protein